MRLYPGVTQGKLQKALRERKIRVNMVKGAASTRLQYGDTLSVEVHLDSQWACLAKERLPRQGRTDVDFSPLILDETANLLVLNKPSGLDVQGGTKVAVHLDSWLRHYCPESRLVHRIDKMTSGLLVVAKNLQTAIFLAERFRCKDIQKTYKAVVLGRFAEPAGTINRPIQDGSGIMKEAQTSYRVLREEAAWSEVELTPQTGRKHQLRIHMASYGYPIIGDTKYDVERKTMGLLSPKTVLFLHAYRLALRMPSGQKSSWTAPLPQYWPE